MNDAASPPPGATSVPPDPAEEPTRPQGQPHEPPREGIDTDNLRDYRALRREVHDRKIAGVCGGLARHLDIDPTLVRVVMVVLVFFGGAGLLLYAALWLFVPEQGTEKALIPVSEGARSAVVVIVLVVALLVALPAGLDGGGGFVAVLVAGVVLAAVLLTRDSSTRAPAGPPPPPAAGPPGWQPDPRQGTPAGYTAPPAAPPGTPSYGYRPKPRRAGPLLFGITLASVVLALGILGLVEATGATVPDAAYPALALAVIGGWLVVGSVFGRPGGLVLLGVIAVAALGVAQLVEPTYEGDRELVERPAVASQLASSYDLPAGRAEIDLRGITDVESLDGRSLEVDVNAGEIVLVVPDGLTVDLDASVAAGGEISTPDVTRGGWDVDVEQRLQSDDSRATLQADLGVGFGRIHVRSE